MHVDYLNITVPDTTDESTKARQNVIALMGLVGAVNVAEGLWRLAAGGTYKITEKSNPDYSVYSASGFVLEQLREHGLYEEYLSSFAEGPHKVTLMHVAHDLPIDTPPVIRKLERRAWSEKGISFTRKRVPHTAKSIRKMVSRRPDDGEETGTLYLGARSAEARARVYDKRQERIDKTGQDVIGAPMTRFELEVTSKVGISLADAHQPESCFWHFMSEVLSPPAVLRPWVSGGLEYNLPPRVPMTPADALKRRVEASGDLENWFRLVDEVGPNGLQYLTGLIERRYRQTRTVQTAESEPGE